MNNQQNKDYLGSKYSEHLFGKSGGHISEQENLKQKLEKESPKNFEENLLWKQVDADDYSKTVTFGICN